MIKTEVKVFNNGLQELPQHSTEYSAGFDFRADYSKIKSGMDFLGDSETFEYDNVTKTLILFGGGRVLIPTGLHIALPDGYELQVRPRSGLALKHGITIVNSPGTVDQDFRGFIGIILLNTSNKPFEIKEGERIGQGVLNRVEQVQWISVNSVEELGESGRGEKGYGSSGRK